MTSRFEIVPSNAQSLAIQGADRDIAISPDGQYIVYRAGGGLAQLVVRAVDRLDAHPLAGITDARQPFFSSDSQWIGFVDGAGLKRVSIAGGSVVTICQLVRGVEGKAACRTLAVHVRRVGQAAPCAALWVSCSVFCFASFVCFVYFVAKRF